MPRIALSFCLNVRSNARKSSICCIVPSMIQRKFLKAKYQAFDPSTTDVFDPEKYHVQEDLAYALLTEVNVVSTVMKLTEEGLRGRGKISRLPKSGMPRSHLTT